MVETAERRRVVTKIPADAGKSSRIEFGKRIKVAAYCRVSTDDEDQLNSYRVQKDYYTRYIANNEKWEFVDVYADEGITGTQVKKRDEFLRMIKDCEKGKIDMILTKSVSRFARNIVDSLSFVRKLKAMGIAIYFEEQNINSLKEDSETYIGIYSVMAQSESENISTNVKWGISNELYLVEKGIHDEQIRIEEFADLAIQSKNNKDRYTEAIADCSQRIKDLRERRDMLVAHIRCNEKAREEIERIENYTKQMKPIMTEFDDAIIHLIVNSIQVTKNLNLRIFIKGGAEIVEPLFRPAEESA